LERIKGLGATRGGVLSVADIQRVRKMGQKYTQRNGATVHVLENAAGRLDVVVDGTRGLITTFENISQKSHDRLAKNYGWE
jgi:hypothetical protein